MRVVPMFRSQALAPLVRYVEAACDPATVFRGRASSVLDRNGLIPVADGGIAFEQAVCALGQPDLGVRLGEHTRPEEIGPLAAVTLTRATLGGALAALVCNGSRFNTGQVYGLEQVGDEARLHRSYTRALSRGRAQVGEFALQLSLQLFRLAAGPGWRPSEICFEGDPPAYAERLAALAERGVTFGSPHTTVVFPARLLLLPLPKAARIDGVCSDAPLPSTDPGTSLRQAIEALLRRGRVDVRQAAEAAGQSVRSFQRGLRAGGLRFAEILEEQRFLAARRLLADGDRKVIDVAVALGYTDSANFTRAFRRWAGLSPQAFRRATLVAAGEPRL